MMLKLYSTKMCNLSAILNCLLIVSAFADPCYLGCYKSDSPLGRFKSASVATDGQLCAPIGRQILQIGGNAADAAISVLLCMGVVNPHSQGLGGGGFIVIYNTTAQNATVIDAREVAPAAATADMFEGNSTTATVGGLAIAVPGELAGYWELHKRFGRLPWAELFVLPANLAYVGFRVGKHFANALKESSDRIKKTNLR